VGAIVSEEPAANRGHWDLEHENGMLWGNAESGQLSRKEEKSNYAA
jgi:hypothetical protein